MGKLNILRMKIKAAFRNSSSKSNAVPTSKATDIEALDARIGTLYVLSTLNFEKEKSDFLKVRCRWNVVRLVYSWSRFPR